MTPSPVDFSWAGCSRQEPTRGASGIVMLAIKIQDFIDLDVYQEEIEYLTEWIKSSEKLPGVDEVFAPGEFEERNREQRMRDGIPIEQKTWDRLVEAAASHGVSAPAV